MPNWCKNNLKIDANGEKVLELLEYLKDDEGCLTFNKAVPMPKELEDSHSPTPEKKRLMDAYGATNWYVWRLEHWGCKWDASESEFYKRGDTWMVSFQTPWGPPIAFMKNLSKQFSNMTFKLQFADEFEGQYPLGEATFNNGEEVDDRPEEGTEQAKEFASYVWSEIWVDDWRALTGE